MCVFHINGFGAEFSSEQYLCTLMAAARLAAGIHPFGKRALWLMAPSATIDT